jgi:hypothetical protein
MCEVLKWVDSNRERTPLRITGACAARECRGTRCGAGLTGELAAYREYAGDAEAYTHKRPIMRYV